MSTDKETIKEFIREQYSKAAKGEAQSCCGSVCGCNGVISDIG